MWGRREVIAVELGVLEDVGVGLAILALAVALGFALAIAVAVLLVQGRRIPPALTGAAVAFAAAGGTLTGLVESAAWDPGDLDTMRIIATTTAAARLLAFFAVGPVALTLLLGAAFAGARKGPRHPLPAVAAGGLALLTAAVVITGGYVNGDPTFTNLRGLAYAGCGLLVAIAMLSGGGADDNGPEAGAAAAVSFPLVVAAGEGARRGLVELLILMHGFETTAPESRPTLIERFHAVVAPELPWSWATLAVSGLVALVGVLTLVRRGRRPGAAFGGLAWLAVAAIVLAAGDLGPDRLIALATASP